MRETPAPSGKTRVPAEGHRHPPGRARYSRGMSVDRIFAQLQGV